MNVLLGVTGSVAATLTQKFKVELALKGHHIKTIVTNSALKFKESDDAWGTYHTDEDEWITYHLSKKVLHIDLVKWADVFVIAPCSANTLAKISNGICDNLLTSCARAWNYDKNLIVAPSMNTQMFLHPSTRVQCQTILKWGATWVSPQSKKLFCGDEGIGAMANIDEIIKYI